MQFWQLHRDLDIVLLNASHPFDNGYTFPRGLLREPKSHLKRAGVVIVTGAEAAESNELESAKTQARKFAPKVPVLSAGFAPTGLRAVSVGVEYNTTWLTNRRVACVCAIGNPESFESMLEKLCASVEPRFRFRDHQAVDGAELDQILLQAVEAGAEAIVTTEKDAVRMNFSGDRLPILALQVSMQVSQESELETILVSLVGKAKHEQNE